MRTARTENSADVMARLVGQDSDAMLEVEAGETLLGRGPVLKVVDKRVSRSHAVLEWGNGVLRICPKHSNPCFLRPDVRSEFRALVRDEWVELHHGNEISLLPDSLRYTVELEGREEEAGQQQDRKREEISLEKGGGEGSEEGMGAGIDRAKKVGMNRQETSEQSEVSAGGREGKKRSEVSAGGREGKKRSEVSATSTGRRRILPSWLSQSSTPPAPSSSRTGPSSAEPPHHSQTRETAASSGKAPAKRKRKLSPSSEHEEEEEEEEEERQLTRPTAARSTSAPQSEGTRAPQSEGTSAPQSEGTSAPQSEGTSAPQSEGSVISPSLESGETPLPPCPYGATCYRKNPAHFREYSHSSGDDRPHCPYGIDCYRKNSEHRRQFQHTAPPAERPAATTAAKRTRQTRTKRDTKRVLAGESDDSQGPNTYDYTDSFIDDEGMSSGSTSYGGESEDSDWAPHTKGGGEEQEEAGDLVTEAKDFISNQKMWQP